MTSRAYLATSRALLAACAMALATPAIGQTFALDTDYADGMKILNLDLLIDAPVGTPVYISSYALCQSDDGLFAVGLSRLEPSDYTFGLVQATRQPDGTVTLIIPDEEDPFGDGYDAYENIEDPLGLLDGSEFEDDTAYDDLLYELEDNRTLILWTLLDNLPCSDWAGLTDDPATLLPVASIDGATSLSELLDTVQSPD